MGSSLIIGQMIATLAQAQRTGGERAQDFFGARGEAQYGGLVRGQVLGARVVELLSDQRAVMELAGNRYIVEGSTRLSVGQAVTLRVSETGARLVLDLVAERTPAEQNLASALRSIFSGADSAKTIGSLSRQVTQLMGTSEVRLPQETWQQLAQQLAPVQVGDDSSRLATKLQSMVRDLGLGLEAFLGKGGSGEAKSAEGLKGSLARLLAAIGDRGAAAARGGSATTALILDFTSRLIQAFDARETAQLEARIEQAVANAVHAEAGSGGRQALDFSLLRSNLLALAKNMPAREAANLERTLDDLLAQLDRRLTAELVREDAGRFASDLRERIETLQLLNVHLRDRGLYQHLFIPVSIFGEMTEVQIKQFLSEKGKGGAGDSLTAVLLLDLESIGRLRIDALLQRRTLYVNISTEREAVAAIVEEMRSDFATQLEARGFTLAKLRATVDERKIDDFHHFDADILAGEEGIVDLQV